VPDPPRPELSQSQRSAASDEKGRFNISGVAPGTYRLYAWVEAVPDALLDPEFLRRFEAKATQVTVGEAEKAQADVTLIEPGDAQFDSRFLPHPQAAAFVQHQFVEDGRTSHDIVDTLRAVNSSYWRSLSPSKGGTSMSRSASTGPRRNSL
jgi:hypothetical protein